MQHNNIPEKKGQEIKPQFILVEGIDGSGKDTLIELLQQGLNEFFISLQLKPQFFFTREPTEFAAAKIENYLKKIKNNGIADDHYLLNLFIEDRKKHSELIRKKLGLGHWVITNRYDLSTYAYQGSGEVSSEVSQGANKKDNSFDYIYEMHAYGKECLIPDFTFFLEVNFETAWQRINQRNKKKEYYEQIKKLKEIEKKYQQAINYLKQKDNRKIVFLKENLSNKDMVLLIFETLGLKKRLNEKLNKK